MSTTTPPSGDELEFQIEKEEWNTYELKDGVKIKGRIIVTRIIRESNAPPGQYSMQTQNIFTTFAPNNLKGPPSNPPNTSSLKQDDYYSIEVINSNEVWNIYNILKTGDRVKIKLVATDVLRVKDSFDQLGQPFYVITSGVMISPVKKGLST